MKHKLFKLGAAAVLTVSGLTTVSSLKPVAAASFKTALKRVKINYLPGKGIRIWTNYQHGHFEGFRAKAGTNWNVAKTAIDHKGRLWYKVGSNEWILARYTIDLTNQQSTTAQPSPKSKRLRLGQLVKKARTKVKATAARVKKPSSTTFGLRKMRVELAKADTNEKTSGKTGVQPKKVKKIKRARQIVNRTLNKKGKKKKARVSQASTRAAAVVKLAKAQVGKAYVWGAIGPATFDCSGLVQYVYAHAAGINLPRITSDQVKVGKAVAINQLQPGNLLFWGSTATPYHVAIYVGNNQYVNAATPDQGVVLQTLSSYFYPTIATRVL